MSARCLGLCNDKRGVQKKMQYLGTQVSLQYELPLAEVVLDFFDRLKSRQPRLRLLRLRVQPFPDRAAGEARHPDQRREGRCAVDHRAPRPAPISAAANWCDKMQELIPRQMFEVAVQAAIGAHIIARATVKALRKNVLAKCYGGDISRKRKLLEKQKAGKKRMKQVGRWRSRRKRSWRCCRSGASERLRAAIALPALITESPYPCCSR